MATSDRLVEMVKAHTEVVVVNEHYGCMCGWRPTTSQYVYGAHDEWCVHMAAMFRKHLREAPVAWPKQQQQEPAPRAGEVLDLRGSQVGAR